MWLAFGAVWDAAAVGAIPLATEEALNLACDFCAKARACSFICASFARVFAFALRVLCALVFCCACFVRFTNGVCFPRQRMRRHGLGAFRGVVARASSDRDLE
jgi:hypothetical protein